MKEDTHYLKNNKETNSWLVQHSKQFQYDVILTILKILKTELYLYKIEL